MTWMAYLPPSFAIYLSLTSGVAGGYLKRSIERWISAGESRPGKTTASSLAGYEDVVANVARDWNARYGFVSAILASILSVITIFADTQNYSAATLMIIVLLAIFSPMLWWIFSYDPDELVSVEKFGLTVATWCKLILIVVNVLLLLCVSARLGSLQLPSWLLPRRP
jgi:hypothetical protein